MKKYIALLMLIAPSLAIAQFTKGQVYLGGTLSTSINNSNYVVASGSSSPLKTTSFSFAPTAGYFVSPKLALGASLGYAVSSSDYDYPYSYITNNTFAYTILSIKSVNKSLQVGTFARYYVPLATNFYFTAQADLTFTRSAFDQTNPSFNGNTFDEVTRRTPSYSLGVSVRPAFVFFPSPRWSVEGGVGTLSFTRTRYLPNVYSANNFTLNVGTFTFGVAYYFKR
ncbi:MAG: outer membrane beta-barrel protein [Bacteroidetes bacterium]|nr:outer membrane beta-barrel protein [Bacteroidota bacterium]